jgi:hypothetical protein
MSGILHIEFIVGHLWCSCRLTVTRRVALVEQALRTLPEHLRLSPVFSVVSVAQSSVFCVVFCRSLFVTLCLFFWTWNCVSHPKLLAPFPKWTNKLVYHLGKGARSSGCCVSYAPWLCLWFLSSKFLIYSLISDFCVYC